MKAKLSTLWVFIMFNMAFIDILGLYIPGGTDEMIEFAGDIPISQLMLYASIAVEVPILMIILSKVLKYKVNRIVNIIGAVFSILFVIGMGSTDPHYLFMGAMEVIAMLLVIWLAWKWKEEGA